jgi:broad specificity phosphatase PhoE
MEIYIARHDESQGNLTQTHMFGTDPLSENGLNQAELLAQRFEKIPIDFVLSSSFNRAKQTAGKVAIRKGLPILVSNLLVEAKRPLQIEGKKISDPEAIKIRLLIKENFQNPDFRFSDEETFWDLQSRADKATHLIGKYKGKRLLIISHGDFIRMLVFTLICKDLLTPELYSKLKAFDLANTGVVHLRYTNSKWEIITWNDRSHLQNIS